MPVVLGVLRGPEDLLDGGLPLGGLDEAVVAHGLVGLAGGAGELLGAGAARDHLAEARGGEQQLRDRINEAEIQFELVERLVPSDAEVAAIYEAIATESQALDLRLINVEPSLPEPADSGAYFLRQEWLMQVEGDYHSLAEFLTRVASFDRIVRPRVTQVAPTEETPSGRQKVIASFGLETYVLAPEAAQEAVPEVTE